MDPLFQPIKINKLEIPNRIYMTAMHLNMLTEYEVTDRICEFYAERAKGGTGAICVGFVSVDRLGSMPLNIGGHEDKYVPGLAKLASAIKNNGSIACAQINHTGPYAYSMMLPKGERPVGPSEVRSDFTNELPRELSQTEILEIIDKFAQTTRRLKEAGYDMVEILMGTGYLVSAFLNPKTNKREDEWGGTPEKRMKFGVEVLKAVRKIAGPDFPIIIRMNGNDMLPGGMRGDELRNFAKALEAAGADAFCINVGWHEAKVPQITMGVPRGNYAYLARGMKEVLKVPVIASHRINDVDDMRMFLEHGYCDMIGMGRGLIADPFFAAKAKENREEEILHCIACSQGCFDHVFILKPVECMVNPEAGHELDGDIQPAKKKKKVAVVGGGPAGMQAALAAHKRGHEVTLFEREEFMGGQLLLAGAPPGREEFHEMIEDYEVQLLAADIDLELGVEVTAELLKEEGFDAAILATGAEPFTPPIPGVDGPNVIQSWDYLAGLEETGRRVVVVGGGAVGIETALALAEVGTVPPETLRFLLIHGAEDIEELRRLAVHGTIDVTMVEMLPKIGKDIGKSTRWTMLSDLERYNVKVLVKHKVLEINKEGVVVEGADGKKTIPADTVVMAVGSKPYNPLEEPLKAMGMEVVVVGDAKKIGLAFDATHAGYRAGREI